MIALLEAVCAALDAAEAHLQSARLGEVVDWLRHDGLHAAARDLAPGQYRPGTMLHH